MFLLFIFCRLPEPGGRQIKRIITFKKQVITGAYVGMFVTQKQANGDIKYGRIGVLGTKIVDSIDKFEQYESFTIFSDSAQQLQRRWHMLEPLELFGLHVKKDSNQKDTRSFGTSTTIIAAADISWTIAKENILDITIPQDATAFKPNLSSWDMSSATNLQNMAVGLFSWNDDSASTNDWSQWKVSNVKSFNSMLGSTYSDRTKYLKSHFTSDVSLWDTSSCTDFGDMFANAIRFNSNLNQWVMLKASNLGANNGITRMFWNCQDFNGDVSTWKFKVHVYDAVCCRDKVPCSEVGFSPGHCLHLPNYPECCVPSNDKAFEEVFRIDDEWSKKYDGEVLVGKFNGDISSWSTFVF